MDKDMVGATVDRYFSLKESDRADLLRLTRLMLHTSDLMIPDSPSNKHSCLPKSNSICLRANKNLARCLAER